MVNSVTGLDLKTRNSEGKAALRVLVTLEIRSIKVNVSSFQRREESAGKIHLNYLSLAGTYPENLFEKVPIN